MTSFAEPIRSEILEKRERAVASLGSWLHAGLLAAAFVSFIRPMALVSGCIAGGAACVFGTLLGEVLVRRRFRLSVLWLFAVLVVGLSFYSVSFLLRIEFMPEMFGPEATLHVAESLRYGGLGFGAMLALRATSLRYRAALALEGSLLVLAVASTVAAHRNGMIARPLEVSDWFWTQGVDPVVAFLAIGLVGSLLLAGVLTYGRSWRRTSFQLLVVLLLGFLLAGHIHGLDHEQNDQASGGKEGEDQEGQSGAQKGRAGASGTPSQSTPSELPSAGTGQQNRPAAVVVFHGEADPSTGVYYFRHAAFSQYNGVRLIEASQDGVDDDVHHQFPMQVEDINSPAREALHGRTLVATDVALLTPHTRLFALIDAVRVEPLPNPEPARFVRAYRAASKVITLPFDQLLGHGAGDRTWPDEVWAHYLEAPKDPRYRALADRIRRDVRSEFLKDPLALSLAVKQYLEENATYSFKYQYEGDDPTGQFLFSQEMRGYCVHLASALAFLVRTLGVPARVSAGYAVPAENMQGGSSLLIKSGDAHAWAEIFLEEVGWVPIEVTPKATDVKPQSFQESDLQQLLGEMARKEGQRAEQINTGWRLKDLLAWIKRVVPWVLGAMLVMAYTWKLWRLFLAPIFSSRRGRPRAAYRAALDRLSLRGLVRGHGEPRERFAKRIAPLVPSFSLITDVHIRQVFGPPGHFEKSNTSGLVSLVWRTGREAGRATPWWKSWWGFVNPISWLWSR